VSPEGRGPDDLRESLARVGRRLDDLARGLARIDAGATGPAVLPGEALDEPTRARLRELESLLALGPPLSSEEIRFLAVDRVIHGAGADCAALFLPAAGGVLETVSGRGLPAGSLRIGLSESIVGRAFVQREVIRAGPGHEASDRLVRELGLAHALAVPVEPPGGPMLGVLFAGRRRAAPFGHHEIETIVLVAERLAHPLAPPVEGAGSVTPEMLTLDLDGVARAIVEAAAARLGATHVALLMPEGERLRLAAARGLPDDAASPDPGAAPLAAALAGARTWVAVRDGDDGGLGRFLGVPAQLAAPLAVGEQVVGVVVAGAPAPLAPAAIAGLLPVAARALQNARIHGETVAALAARDAWGRSPEVTPPQPVRDFGNLLAVILARIGLARERVADPGVGADLRVAEEAAWRAAEAVRGVLGLAPGGRDAPAAPLELTALVREAVDAAARRWASRQPPPAVTLDLQPVPPIRGRAADLHAALDHVLDNAAEAVALSGAITVRTRWDGDRTVALVVEDSGAGMEETLRARALDPFFSTRGPGRLGLGLPVAHAIVTQHGGTLVLSSTPGLGTTVRLSFTTASSAGQAPPAAAEPPAPRPARVLVVEADRAVRQALAAVLGRGGHVVIEAPEAPEAIAAVERELVDVVFTSLTVPGSSGLELAADVKRLRPGTPVVLLTAWPERLDEAVVRRSGVDRVVDKPAGTAEVLAALDAALAMRRTIRP
jgi:signal transduction histidine kinase/ActR/RegA family two-component response regulator